MSNQVQPNEIIAVDEDGYLIDFSLWSETVARLLAEREGIPKLTDEHFEVLHTIRRYYEKFHVAPMLHLLAKECGKTYRELYTLFKKQPGKKASKLAGLPKASGCV